MKRKIKSNKKIGGWLIAVLIVFGVSLLSSFVLLADRVISIFAQKAAWGVYVSVVLLFLYCFFLLYSGRLILNKKKKGIIMGIIALWVGFIFDVWYYLIGGIIFYEGITSYNLINTFINLAFVVAISFYLKRSKRVRDTLVR